MMLPEPEYAQLSGMAARNKAFMIELKGEVPVVPASVRGGPEHAVCCLHVSSC
jgi:hypothetical protein